MDHTPPGRFKTAEAFRARWRELDPAGVLDLSGIVNAPGFGGRLGSMLD